MEQSRLAVLKAKEKYEQDAKEADELVSSYSKGFVDHIKGLKVFEKKYNIPVYMTEKMYNCVDYLDKYQLLADEFNIKDIHVTTIKTSHDTDDSVGYIFEEDDHSFVYITDTGYFQYKAKHCFFFSLMLLY